MFGFRFIKVQPTTYLLQYRKGHLVREGTGLAFFYYGPTTSLVAVPTASNEVPFIFEETTADFQKVTIQGQITYRVADPKKLAALMNFTLAPNGQSYASDDPEKLPQRLINIVNVHARAQIQRLPLRQAVRESDGLVEALRPKLVAAPEVAALGLEILGFSILAIKPTPETARALEAETREQLLKEADEAIFRRRNAAVENERAIKENELNTENAVELKKRQIRETKMDAERAVQEKQRLLREAEMAASIALEQKKKDLVELTATNARGEADARAYGIEATMKALGTADPRVLAALANAGMNPEQLIAVAFQGIADKADKIGQLNISPDLLRELMGKQQA
ncbi:SPFH domain-containing protein [Opitutus terrae]|uniref:Band 7 protein n=1 Tax=Opitutus terrae (strain DSM 11246 / JCM 15787 / PB90-1) TaxID=452637 RepID=B1ZMI4_OPITP|nr:SPFH domain-containing protein [Opitutus terrae]ACB74329.1 band 7 protein [Opitutus terrae PB90-1]